MTRVGAGGLRITKVTFKPRFQRDRRKLPPEIRERLNEKLKSLYQDPMPPGLRFEKLKGYSRPDIYTFHIDGNYKGVALILRPQWTGRLGNSTTFSGISTVLW